MKRLTWVLENGEVECNKSKDECFYLHEEGNGGCWDCDLFPKIIERLAEVENILGEEYDLDRLRTLVEADKDGRCVVLPKDRMVYYIEQSGGEKWVANKPIQQIILKCGWGLASLSFSLFDANKYFTREAAESALNEAKLKKPGNNHFMNRFMEVK